MSRPTYMIELLPRGDMVGDSSRTVARARAPSASPNSTQEVVIGALTLGLWFGCIAELLSVGVGHVLVLWTRRVLSTYTLLVVIILCCGKLGFVPICTYLRLLPHCLSAYPILAWNSLTSSWAFSMFFSGTQESYSSE